MNKNINKTKQKAILINAISRDTSALINLVESLQDEELTLLTPMFLQDSHLPIEFSKNIKYLSIKTKDIDDNTKNIEGKKDYKFNNKSIENASYLEQIMRSREILFWETVDYLEEALEDYDILLVVVTNEAFIHERIFLKFAEKYNIPKIHINHGYNISITQSAYKTGNCDYYCTATEEDAITQLYDAEKTNPNYDYKCTGIPLIDKYYLLSTNKENIIPKNLPKDKKIISFFPTFENTVYVYYPGMDVYQTSLETSLKIAEKLHSDPDTFIVIKDRPTNYQFAKEKFDLLLNKYSNLDKDRIIYTFDYPEPWAIASDIVVQFGGTTAVEAVISGALAININLYSNYYFTSKVHMVNIHYKDEHAGDYILSLLNDSNKMQILKDLQNNEQLIGEMQDGLSSLRVAKYVSDIIGFEKTSIYIENQINSIHEWQKANPNPNIDELLSDKNPHSKYWKIMNSLLKYDHRFRVSDEYEEWKKNQILTDLEGELLANRINNFWRTMPIFHLIYIVDASMFDALSSSLGALEYQFYKNFIISVISTDEIPDPELLELENFYWIKTDQPFAMVNKVIEDHPTDWVILPIAGDELHYNALMEFAEHSNLFPDWLSMYADEDKKFIKDEDSTKTKEKLNQSEQEPEEILSSTPGDLKKTLAIDSYYENLQAKMPLFKPDFNLELYRSTDYIGQTVAIKTDLIKALGGFLELPYTQSTQMLFVLAEQMSVPAIGHIPKILNHKSEVAQSIENFDAIKNAQIIIRQEHLKRCGYNSEFAIIDGLKPNTYKTVFKSNKEPRLAVLVDFYSSESTKFIECFNSLNNQTYQNLEIFLSIPSDLNEKDIKILNKSIEILQKKYKVHSLNKSIQANKREILEEFVNLAQDFEFWYFLQSDLELLQINYFEELLNHTVKPEVAMVGGRIIDTNMRVLSAGQVLGFNQDVDDIYKNFHLEQDLEALSRLWCDQNYSALSPLAILIRKSAFDEVGGFDKEFLDYYLFADLGIRMQIAGKRLHWTPYANCVSYQEINVYKANRSTQLDLWYEKWGQLLLRDPNHNLNLELKESGSKINKIYQNWFPYFKQLPRVIDYPLFISLTDLNDLTAFTTILSRIMLVKEELLYQRVNGEIQSNPGVKINPIDVLRTNPDVIVFMGTPFYEDMKKDIKLIKKHYGKKLIAFLSSQENVENWKDNFEDIDHFILINKDRNEFKGLPKDLNCITIDIKFLTDENLDEYDLNDPEKMKELNEKVDLELEKISNDILSIL